MNEIIGGQSRSKNSWNSYNDLKRRWYGQIKLLVQVRRVQPVGPGYMTFIFSEPNRKRDPDNICAGGIKLILDSLVGAEVLAGDGWNAILGFVGYWVVGASPGCLVVWDERQTLSKPEMEGMLEKELAGNANEKSGR